MIYQLTCNAQLGQEAERICVVKLYKLHLNINNVMKKKMKNLTYLVVGEIQIAANVFCDQCR